MTDTNLKIDLARVAKTSSKSIIVPPTGRSSISSSDSSWTTGIITEIGSGGAWVDIPASDPQTNQWGPTDGTLFTVGAVVLIQLNAAGVITKIGPAISLSADSEIIATGAPGQAILENASQINQTQAALDEAKTELDASMAEANTKLAENSTAITKLNDETIPGLKDDLSDAKTELGSLISTAQSTADSASSAATTAQSAANAAQAAAEDALASAPDMVKNGGFETGDLAFWTATQPPRAQVVSISDAHGGVCALQITTAAAWLDVYQPVSVNPQTVKAGRTYRLAAWIRRISGSGALSVRVNLKEATSSRTDKYGACTSLAETDTTWKLYEQYITPSVDTRVVVSITDYVSNGSGSVWQIDDVELKDVTDVKTAAAAAVAAQTTADTAVANAATAKTAADTAQAAALGAQATADAAASKASTADGRYTVATANPTVSDGTGKPTGAVWEVRSGSTSLRRFVWSGSAWTQVKIGQDFIGEDAIGRAQIGDAAIGTAQIGDLEVTDAKIGTLALSKLIAGSANVADAVIQKLSVGIAKVIQLSVDKLIVGDGNFSTAVAQKIVADTAAFLKITTDMLVAGNATITNELLVDTLIGKIIRGGLLSAGTKGTTPYVWIGGVSDTVGTSTVDDEYGIYLETPDTGVGYASTAHLVTDATGTRLELERRANGVRQSYIYVTSDGKITVSSNGAAPLEIDGQRATYSVAGVGEFSATWQEILSASTYTDLSSQCSPGTGAFKATNIDCRKRGNLIILTFDFTGNGSSMTPWQQDTICTLPTAARTKRKRTYTSPGYDNATVGKQFVLDTNGELRYANGMVGNSFSGTYPGITLVWEV